MRGLQSEAEGAAPEEQEEEEEVVEEEEEVVEEEEEEEEQAFPVSLEDLAGHEGNEKVPGPEPPGSEAEEEEEEEEESLAVVEQVADFASSLLAALHCWHYRANALLFSRGAMVRCLFDLPCSLHVPWHVNAPPMIPSSALPTLPCSFPLAASTSQPPCLLSRPGEPLACTIAGLGTYQYSPHCTGLMGWGQRERGKPTQSGAGRSSSPGLEGRAGRALVKLHTWQGFLRPQAWQFRLL
jgi:hypothetical protein